MQLFKKSLSAIGLLKKLDSLAAKSRRYHYIRSLFAIHQLDDMIFLDVPWWTYSAIKAIDQHIQRLGYKPSAFEYGSGASTIWLAKRCATVISVEHDSAWYYQLKNNIKHFPEVQLDLKKPTSSDSEIKYSSHKLPQASFEQYVKTIEDANQQYDLIIIDGRCREMCLQSAVKYLKPDGIIILDNSNRARYQQALKTSGLQVQRFYGRVPGSPFKSETAILRK